MSSPRIASFLQRWSVGEAIPHVFVVVTAPRDRLVSSSDADYRSYGREPTSLEVCLLDCEAPFRFQTSRDRLYCAIASSHALACKCSKAFRDSASLPERSQSLCIW